MGNECRSHSLPFSWYLILFPPIIIITVHSHFPKSKFHIPVVPLQGIPFHMNTGTAKLHPVLHPGPNIARIVNIMLLFSQQETGTIISISWHKLLNKPCRIVSCSSRSITDRIVVVLLCAVSCMGDNRGLGVDGGKTNTFLCPFVHLAQICVSLLMIWWRGKMDHFALVPCFYFSGTIRWTPK